MSDADNQMGGSGGETGRSPGGAPRSSASDEARAQEPRRGDEGREGRTDQDEVTEESKESFPASDPPANY